MQVKKLFFDCETTGLDPKRNSIIQLSGIIEIEDEVVDHFDFRMRPFEGDMVSPESLQINNISMDTLRSYPTPQEVFGKLMVILNKHVNRYDTRSKLFLIGYNAGFDANFLESFLVKNGERYYTSYFWWPPLDVATMAGTVLMDIRHKFPNFKLETVCKVYGIELEEHKLHDALYDAELTRHLYHHLID